MILAWHRDLHVLLSQGCIVANCFYLGGSVPTFVVKMLIFQVKMHKVATV